MSSSSNNTLSQILNEIQAPNFKFPLYSMDGSLVSTSWKDENLFKMIADDWVVRKRSGLDDALIAARGLVLFYSGHLKLELESLTEHILMLWSNVQREHTYWFHENLYSEEDTNKYQIGISSNKYDNADDVAWKFSEGNEHNYDNTDLPVGQALSGDNSPLSVLQCKEWAKTMLTILKSETATEPITDADIKRDQADAIQLVAYIYLNMTRLITKPIISVGNNIYINGLNRFQKLMMRDGSKLASKITMIPPPSMNAAVSQ